MTKHEARREACLWAASVLDTQLGEGGDLGGFPRCSNYGRKIEGEIRAIIDLLDRRAALTASLPAEVGRE